MRAMHCVSAAAAAVVIWGTGHTAWADGPAETTAQEVELAKAAAATAEPVFVLTADESPAGLPTKLSSAKYGVSVTLYGFLEATIAYNQSRMNSITTPVTVNQETAAFHGEGHWRIHARHTRFGVAVKGQAIDGLFDATPEGKIEIDFFGGGSESRNLIRMRKAYLKLAGAVGEAGEWSFLLGQDSDTYSPLFPSVNYDMLMWGSGNTGDRRPQMRVGYKSTGDFGFGVDGALGLTDAVATQDADTNGQRDGENADWPMLQGRAFVTMKMSAKKPLAIGLWGARSWYKTDTVTIKTDNRQNAWLVGLDFFVPIGARENGAEMLYIKGEAFSGGNMADYRGGVFSTYDGNGDPVKGAGGWIEAGFNAADWLTLLGGYGIDDPDNEDVRTLGAGTITDNQAVWGGAVFNFKPVKIGAEVIHWQTRRIASNISNSVRFRVYLRLYF